MNAMMFPFISDGIPILYYGQEQGYAGAEDPYNREARVPCFSKSKSISRSLYNYTGYGRRLITLKALW
jgi:glycosidase